MEHRGPAEKDTYQPTVLVTAAEESQFVFGVSTSLRGVVTYMNLWFISISQQLGQSEKIRGDRGQQRAVTIPVLLVDTSCSRM